MVILSLCLVGCGDSVSLALRSHAEECTIWWWLCNAYHFRVPNPVTANICNQSSAYRYRVKANAGCFASVSVDGDVSGQGHLWIPFLCDANKHDVTRKYTHTSGISSWSSKRLCTYYSLTTTAHQDQNQRMKRFDIVGALIERGCLDRVAFDILARLDLRDLTRAEGWGENTRKSYVIIKAIRTEDDVKTLLNLTIWVKSYRKPF